MHQNQMSCNISFLLKGVIMLTKFPGQFQWECRTQEPLVLMSTVWCICPGQGAEPQPGEPSDASPVVLLQDLSPLTACMHSPPHPHTLLGSTTHFFQIIPSRPTLDWWGKGAWEVLLLPQRAD